MNPTRNDSSAKLTILGALLLLFLTLPPARTQTTNSPQTWQGFVTDTHCGTNCQVTKDMKPDKKCIDRCVREGSKYGLWVAHHVYELEPQRKAAGYAGREVAVTGTFGGETIHIDFIEVSKRPASEKPKSN
jgi:hypothetical protein